LVCSRTPRSPAGTNGPDQGRVQTRIADPQGSAQDYPRRVCMRPAPSWGRDDTTHPAGHRPCEREIISGSVNAVHAFPAKAGIQPHKASARQRTIFDNAPNTGPPPARGRRRMELQRDVGCILMHRGLVAVHQDAPYTAPPAPRCLKSKLVIPAAARSAESGNPGAAPTGACRPWVPACAGMTTKGNCLHQSKTGGGGSPLLSGETEGAAPEPPEPTASCR